MGDNNSKIEDINTLILDVDGVLTDGSMIYADDGRELKIFHVRDGKGIALAKGAVREAIETILKKQGRWEKVIEKDLQRQLNEKR